MFAVQKLEKVSLIDQVVDHLRESIMNGDLPPGAHLREVELARQLAVSRGSLREGLIRLEAEGLVVSHAGRGTFVSRLSDRDVEEIYALRMLLECEAVRLATRHINAAQIKALRGLAQAIMDSGQAGDIPAVLKQNIVFHTTIWHLSGNQRLVALLRSLYAQVQLYLATTLHYQDKEHRRRTDQEHIDMVEAMAARDAEKAAAVMQTHLREAERLLRMFRDRAPAVRDVPAT